MDVLGVTHLLCTQKFPKNKHLLLPDMPMCVRVTGVRNVIFSGKFCLSNKRIIPCLFVVLVNFFILLLQEETSYKTQSNVLLRVSCNPVLPVSHREHLQILRVSGGI